MRHACARDCGCVGQLLPLRLLAADLLRVTERHSHTVGFFFIQYDEYLSRERMLDGVVWGLGMGNGSVAGAMGLCR